MIRREGFFLRLTAVEKALVRAAAKVKTMTVSEFARRACLFDAAGVFEFEGPEFKTYEQENGGSSPKWFPGIDNQELFENMHWFLVTLSLEELEVVRKRCWEETGKGDVAALVRRLLLGEKNA